MGGFTRAINEATFNHFYLLIHKVEMIEILLLVGLQVLPKFLILS